MSDWAALLVTSAADKLTRDLAQIRRCAALLTEEQRWWRANAHCNSVGNLLLHLRGNVRQWVLGGLAGDVSPRARAAEFSATAPPPGVDPLQELVVTVHAADDVIRTLDADRLLRTYEIQGYRVHGLEAVFHVAEHFAAHTAQIVQITKTLCDVDLSLYDAEGHRLDAGANP